MPSRKIRKVIENRPILCATPELTVREAASLMSSEHVGSIMVIESDHLIGIFTERDALTRVLAAGGNPDQFKLRDVMTASPRTIDLERPLGHALHMMYEGGFRHVPVTQHGKVVGMVSARDALGPELISFQAELEQRDEITERL